MFSVTREGTDIILIEELHTIDSKKFMTYTRINTLTWKKTPTMVEKDSATFDSPFAKPLTEEEIDWCKSYYIPRIKTETIT